MSEPGPVIQLCFCPPMDDPDDPDQHKIGCLHAEALYRQAFWDRMIVDEIAALWPRYTVFRQGLNQRPTLSASSGGCYRASWGWVHVKPGCRCPR